MGLFDDITGCIESIINYPREMKEAIDGIVDVGRELTGQKTNAEIKLDQKMESQRGVEKFSSDAKRARGHNAAYGYSPTGHIDSDGRIHNHPYGWSPTGRIDDDGLIHNHPYGHSPVGHIDDSGVVHDDPYGYSPTGHIDGSGLLHS